ncbi:MAG: 4Fe-4S double cluster binding domain-containing protein [Methanomassiliicoccales archaeon]
MAITREEVEKAAKERGIDSVAVVSLRSLQDNVVDSSAKAGGSQSADLRRLAQSLLPEAASAIVLAAAYYDERTADLSRSGDPRGIIGRGLWKDHAAGLRRKTDSLIAFLEDMGVKAVLAEELPLRDVAQRAGLGTLGKNSLLQSFDNGSWVLLTALVTDAELPSGEKEDCRCGSCQTCLRMCPTKAITSPFKVDGSRCIDRLLSSVEEIPLELRGAIGTRIFSCDICQEVCPRNKFVLPAKAPMEDRFGRWTRSPSLGPLVMMSEEQYKTDFDWIEWSAPNSYLLRRNAIIALGNSGDQIGTNVLVKKLHDPDPRLRGYASWALGQIGDITAVRNIKAALQNEQDSFAKEEMRLALVRLSEKREG